MAFLRTMHLPYARATGKPRNYAALALLLLAAAACATVPNVDQDIATAIATSSHNSTILGADGPLTVAQSRRLLAGVSDEGDGDTLLQRHLAIEAAIAGTPLTAGNATELLRDGDGTFAAVFEAIRNAKHHINLEYYTLEDVVHDGQHLSDLLIAKRRAGVAV